MIDLTGKSALITGSARGIGRSIAEKLAAAGAKIGINDINAEAAAETAEQIAAQYGVETWSIQADVSSEADVKTMIQGFVETFGGIDILVNNAGITKDGLSLRMKESDWDAVLNINLKSAFLCSRTAARKMLKAKQGSIINISSVVGVTGNAGQVNYSAAKAGMLGLTKSLAKEYAGKAVRVNAVAPGFIKSAMTDKLSPEVISQYEEAIPLKELGDPEDIAHAVLFLSSDLSSYITGQVMGVNGGMAM
ncbi:3-oxoacyl-(acyl-carrier-protein) reductase [Chitinivibrio alkaliphilus ACht1]|uniref:3-oxoacyl-[acyl-carrier-protein] reductase n=1 Tax=Chitinivibrio alkaliphilus ACht1 TaxID=1313304 RepID=U7DCS6_9BACT|nr:3-oxoacyl-[acyl-carrier-protein] reductase [Chitinivibrio alkaliphilus]ERP38701.1 3-oxoacyl-(acyl-carrier-protein) reductase [Chitinivibrio alkaliphilus ACht1]